MTWNEHPVKKKWVSVNNQLNISSVKKEQP
jgi:hypothetical protein